MNVGASRRSTLNLALKVWRGSIQSTGWIDSAGRERGGGGGGGERVRKGLGFPELHLVFIIDSMRADSEPLEISTRLMHYYIIISGRINSLPAFLFFFFLLPNQCKNIPGCININRVIKMP